MGIKYGGKKVAYIIPGYGDSYLKQSAYRRIGQLFEDKGITPIHVEIDWRYRKPARFADYAKQFSKQYKKQKNIKVYVFGFSYGAIIAFLTAAELRPKTLILCSLSPYFQEDLKNLKPGWLRWWKKNFIASDYLFTKLASKIKSKTYFMVGDQEHLSCLIRAKDARRKLKDSSLYIAKGAKHKIGQNAYLKTLRRVISKL